jgi:hypothetical protein
MIISVTKCENKLHQTQPKVSFQYKRGISSLQKLSQQRLIKCDRLQATWLKVILAAEQVTILSPYLE